MNVIGAVGRRIALGFGLVCGVIASQGPEYAQQYRQRLGGAIDELTRIVQEFDADSARAGMTRAEGVKRLEDSPDEFVRGRGVQMTKVSARLDRLGAQQQAFAQAGPYWRLGALARDFDAEVAQRAWSVFEPAVPVTSESFVIGGAGVFVGYLLARIVSWPLRARRRRLSAA